MTIVTLHDKDHNNIIMLIFGEYPTFAADQQIITKIIITHNNDANITKSSKQAHMSKRNYIYKRDHPIHTGD